MLHRQEEANPYDGCVVAPTANGCYRPIDPDKARKVEDRCVQPLPEARKLQGIDTSVAKKQALPVENCLFNLCFTQLVPCLGGPHLISNWNLVPNFISLASFFL